MHNQSGSGVFGVRRSLKKVIKFCKMQSLGNDFMVVDAVTQKVYFSTEYIQQLADRHRGVGFDQLLLVEPPHDPDFDFHYRIFNADGSEAAQCGNGACALALFLHLKGLTNRRELWISTQSGKLLLALLADNQVRVMMDEPCFEPRLIPFQAYRHEKRYFLRLQGQVVPCGVVSMGNPHCVILVDDCGTAPLASLGMKIAQHKRFRQRTNVGFMQIVTPRHIRLRVYERGVGETQACGSGACAAVAVGIDQGILSEAVQVDLPGGTLRVCWQGLGHPLYLVSTASQVYDGALPYEG